MVKMQKSSKRVKLQPNKNAKFFSSTDGSERELTISVGW